MLPLEDLLRMAILEPAYRPEFYTRILEEDVIVLASSEAFAEGEIVASEAVEIRLLAHGDGSVPVFTSADRIYDNNMVEGTVQYYKIGGRNLFEATKGVTLVLNPYSEYGKEFLPEEVEQLLGGRILSALERPFAAGEAEVEIGEPMEMPLDMCNSLSILFAQHPQVRAAYLALIRPAGSQEDPHFIIALDADDESPELFNAIGYTANSYLGDDAYIDMMVLGKSKNLAPYFYEEAKPFYVKE